jgi:methylthioribose-1-phosphate isomerase
MGMDLDAYLPPLLKKSTIAKIEGRQLLIGDRRSYPWEMQFVPCDSVDAVSQAIKDMVTQGGGPLQVGLTTMRFIARKIHAGEMPDHARTFLDAAQKLSSARPTNTTMARTLQHVVSHIARWYVCSGVQDVHANDLVGFVDSIIDSQEAAFDADYDIMGDLGSRCISDSDGILTTCFAEHSFLVSLAKAKEQGKSFTVFVPETRPYLQGARLTAPSLHEMGIDAYVITDGMGAHYMRDGAIQLYMTAADLVTMDGTVVNKVGTLANAISANHYDIPYYAFAMSPDPSKKSSKDIIMEERDGKEILDIRGVSTTLDSMKGRYPAFDIIDPPLVDGIITPKGILKPHEIAREFDLSYRNQGADNS